MAILFGGTGISFFKNFIGLEIGTQYLRSTWIHSTVDVDVVDRGKGKLEVESAGSWKEG